ncbi:TetR/AcrR family transcriptional regulator [Parvularcula lutaonensis]|uniref:TetR/AcrR family transcriptional regulator n=1 Tax=Parvularcula lutaonensis TaxID=491923 RepID=A0ABV7M8S8_9PROT|nr:TetR/AcrR family transcriptional regulator [Parvularcula lutaonensis]GGY56861.1 TetR family transcriptional regulator [Parvularcula lutaonensis]
MRARLVEATLDCLATNGYARLTISSIVERAGVSRGAPLHHFQSKQALIEAAADHLFRRVSRKVSSAYEDAVGAEDPVSAFLTRLWRDIFTAPEGAMLAELNHASRHEPDLQSIMSSLWTRIYRIASRVSARYVRTRQGTVPPERIALLTQWLMRGMAQDFHLGAPDALFERYLEHWRALLDSALPRQAARKT